MCALQEMELICQLKGNIEQLHQEISELRRSIKSCVNMQMELQQSTKQDIAAALCQSGVWGNMILVVM